MTFEKTFRKYQAEMKAKFEEDERYSNLGGCSVCGAPALDGIKCEKCYERDSQYCAKEA